MTAPAGTSSRVVLRYTWREDQLSASTDVRATLLRGLPGRYDKWTPAACLPPDRKPVAFQRYPAKD